MAVTIAVVIKNVWLSMHRKANLVTFRSCIQTLANLTHFMAQKPDQTPAVQSIHNLSGTEAGLKNAVAAKTVCKKWSYE
jgi:hypothetical protein